MRVFTPLSNLIYLCIGIILFLTSCEKDDVSHLSDTAAKDCLFQDCITSKNSSLIKQNSATLEGLPEDVHEQMEAFWIEYEQGDGKEQFGFPAWNLLEEIEETREEIEIFYLPLLHNDSESINGFVAILTVRDELKFNTNLITVSDIPLLPKRARPNLFASGLTIAFDRLAAVEEFQRINMELFGKRDEALTAYERPLAYQKDCVTTLYQIITCQDIMGGQNAEEHLYTECNTTTTVETGCSGGDSSSGSTGGPTGGGGGGGGGGPTGGPTSGGGDPTVYINNRNRCIEDGVGCDEGDGNDPPSPQTITLDLDCQANSCMCESIKRVMLLGGTGRISQ